MRSIVLPALFAAVLLVDPNPARAASLSSPGASVTGSGFGDSGSPAGPNTRRAADEILFGNLNRSAEAIARADVGSVAGYTRASILPAGGPASGVSIADVSAFFLLDGIVVTRLPGFEGLPSTVEATARLTFDPGSSFGDISSFSGSLSGGTEFALGGLSSATPTATSTALLTVGASTFLDVAIQMSVQQQGAFGTVVAAFNASFDPLQAFEVPEGYVVNAQDGHIVNNVYVGPSGPVIGGVEGDYNFDGLVNAPDYTTWRDGLGTIFMESDYAVWANNFGETAGSPSHAVPEPAAGLFSLLIIGAGWSCVAQARYGRNK